MKLKKFFNFKKSQNNITENPKILIVDNNGNKKLATTSPPLFSEDSKYKSNLESKINDLKVLYKKNSKIFFNYYRRKTLG